MASASTPNLRDKCGRLPKSHFNPTVCLTDWWLSKAENDFEGSRLAVAGFSYRKKQALRVFQSAPILKRYDMLTLETSDGVYVILNGLMNKAQTLENGFPSDVCNHFGFGFPPYWKDYNEKFMIQEPSSGNIPGVNIHSELSPQSEGKKLYEDRHENDLGMEDGMNAKDVQKNKKPICVALMALQYLQTSNSVVSGDNINKSSISSRVHEHSDSKVPILKRKQKSYKKTARISGVEMTTLNSLLPVGDEKVESAYKTKGNKKLEKNKSTSLLSSGAAAENHKQKISGDVSSLSENGNISGLKMGRMAYETPDIGQEKASATSSELMRFTISRSGRLLMPSLEFWRNQRAIYDVDRTVTEIQESLQLNEPKTGSRSEPPRSRARRNISGTTFLQAEGV